jgi:ribosomal protein S8
MKKQLIYFLLILKNFSILNQEKIVVNFNKKFYNFCEYLYKEGLIQSFFIKKEKKNFKLEILLRSSEITNLLSNLKIISKPSISKYLKYIDICKINEKGPILVISTIKGLASIFDCKKNKIGGKLLFII